MTRSLTCRVRRDGDVALVLAPAVGHWVDRPRMGTLVRPGDPVGHLSILGRRHSLVVPDGVFGEIVGGLAGSPQREIDVSFGDVLLRVDPTAAVHDTEAMAASSAAAAQLVLRSPSSGRFWCRPAPDQPAFVAAGMEIATGQPIGLLEVMKTFTRLGYGGEGLPARARVVRVVPEDGEDVDAGAVLLELEDL